MIGEVFKQSGYKTFGTGKWHNGTDAYARSFTDGDNIFFGGMHDHWCVPVHSFDPDGRYDGRVNKIKDFFQDNHPDSMIADKINAGVHSTEFITDGLLNFLDGQTSDEPFYAYTAYLAPHDPRTMPQKFRDMYVESRIVIPPNFQDYHHIEYDNVQCRDETLAPYPRTIEDTRRQIAEYYAMITHLDNQIGRIIEKLEQKGLLENTVIILAGDNGLALGQHGLFGKQCLYDHSIRVPLIFYGKDIPSDKRCNDLVYLTDIFPTLCDMLNLDIPQTVNGESFYNSLWNSGKTPREHLCFAYTDKIRAITKNGFKYIEHRHGNKSTKSLFNLENDPFEIANLIAQPNYNALIEEMQALMKYESDQTGEMNHVLGRSYWNMDIIVN